MKRLSIYIAWFIFGIVPITSFAQKNDPQKTIESIIESHLNNPESRTDIGLIIEDLEKLLEDPININSTNTSELAQLYILNDIQINKLLNYIKEFGPAYSIFELNTIDGFKPEILSKIEPFIWFGPRETQQEKFKDVIRFNKQQLLLRGLGTIQKAKGYLPKEDGTVPYDGNRFRYYARYRFEAKDNLSAGITAEKDPGEAFFHGSNNNGFDFYSAHISTKINPIIQNITVGDYIVRSGQGLVLWQEYSMGKSENILDIGKTNRGIRPYTSIDENLFFRGIATTLKFGEASLSLFYSNKNVDGNIVSDSIDSYFTSLQTSGYHRTENEIEDKNAVQDRNAGGIFSWSFTHLKVGTTISYQKFDMPFIRKPQLYNQFRFSGTENLTGGIDYLYNKGKYQLFGEAALSKSSGKAVLQGATARLTDQVNFSLLFRHFDKNYHAYWSNTFTEGSSTINETGLFLGTNILPVKFVTLSAYSDFYRSEWFNFSTIGPSKGWDIFAQADFVFSRNFEFYFRYKNEEKDYKYSVEERYLNLPRKLQKTRFHVQYKPKETITLKTRFEHALYKGVTKENGFVLFQDIQYTPENIPINISGRLAYFNTDGYNSRIYAYENDLLYTFSIPAYYGKGFRSYLNLRYKISKKMDFWLKIANTFWNDRNTISSGYNEISGSNKTELKLQLRLKI